MMSGMRERGRNEISAVTRRDITDYISVERVDWAGRLDEVAFLQRVWPDLDSMPSTDGRFPNAAGDVWQHRIANRDWEDDWIFDDRRFGLRNGSDESFVRFLVEMLHPIVRPDVEETQALLSVFNEALEADDWEIVETSQMASRPIFEGRRKESVKNPTDAIDVAKYERLDDPQVVRDHLRRIDGGLKSDPAAAIGSSKELVESVCKVILADYDHEYRDGDDLMDLYKRFQGALGLNVDAVPQSSKGSKAAVKSLRALVTILQSLAELRNAIGSGHGRDTRSPALTRHARLAFNAAVAISEFLLDTWVVRRRRDGQL
jgi:hypothetical protein